MNLSELRHTLETQIREAQLPEALQSLLEKLPDGAELYRIVSALISRLNAANKERYRNTITFEAYQLRVDQIAADFFDLLAGMTEADFEAKPLGAKPKTGKQGSVLYRVPNLMEIQKPTRCTIRVAVDEEAILENILLDEHVEIKSRVEISDVMSAELLDPEGASFQISPLNSRTQLVKDSGFTEWNFNVTPLVSGVHQLLVKVSIMEVVPGFAEPIPREVSVLETVTIVTPSRANEAGAAPGASPAAPAPEAFKTTGQSFGFQSSATSGGNFEINYSKAAETQIPSPAPATAPASKSASQNGLKSLAILLAFLVLAPAATWALTPAQTRDWWVASVKDSPEAYAAYIEQYEGKGSPYLEKAYFFKAERTDQLADLRSYQEKYQFQGRYASQVASRINTHEIRAVESIRNQPDASKIRQFVLDFPETERLTELKQAVETRTENRQELLAEVEDAYVAAVATRPTESKVAAYLRDFPEPKRLQEIDAAARTKPEVFSRVQPALEDAYLKKMEQNPTQIQSDQYLEKFPQPVRKTRFEKILEQKPELKKDASIKMRRLEEARRLERSGM